MADLSGRVALVTGGAVAAFLSTSSGITVSVAGSTGSIGTQTLEVIRAEGPERYRVVALGAGSSVDALVAQGVLRVSGSGHVDVWAEDVVVHDYQHHPAIKAPVAV